MYPTDPINKLDLTGMMSADSAEYYAKKGYKLVDQGGVLAAVPYPTPHELLNPPVVRVGPVLQSETMDLRPAPDTVPSSQWGDAEVQGLASGLGIASGILLLLSLTPLAPVALPSAFLFGLAATYVSCAHQRLGGSCGLEVASVGIGAGIGSQVARYGGTPTQGAIWDYMTVGPMFLVH